MASHELVLRSGRVCSRYRSPVTRLVPTLFSVGVYDQRLMTDEDIVEAFCRGDDRATAALYERYGRLVFTVCLRVLGNRTQAEDATQQTFIQAWKGADTFDSSRQFGPWLATIARRVSIDAQRHEQRRPHDSIDERTDRRPDHTDPALIALPPNPEQIEIVWKVREALDGLAAQDRELVRLQHLEGVPQSEIAHRLGLPLGTVKSRSHRIHRQLAATLRGLRVQDDDNGVAGIAEYDQRGTS